MEIKSWTYEEFPEFTEIPEGAVRLEVTGNEIGIRYLHDVEYAVVDNIPLHLQIMVPETRKEPEKKYPCLVYIQGSAWMEQKQYQGICFLDNLAKRGYVIAIVQYRHSGQAKFPAQIQDSRNAIRYMRKNAEKYHVIPEQILVGGDSSGGHTAVFCGIVKDGSEMDENLFPGISADVKGVIDYYGTVNLLMEDGFPTTINHHQPDSPEGKLLGNIAVMEHPELAAKATAITYITPEIDLPPYCIFHGTKDRIANTRHSVELYEKMKECGKDVRLYLVGGADHGGPGFWTEEACDLAEKFIQYCLK